MSKALTQAVGYACLNPRVSGQRLLTLLREPGGERGLERSSICGKDRAQGNAEMPSRASVEIRARSWGFLGSALE